MSRLLRTAGYLSAAEVAVGGFLSGKTIASSSGLEGKLIGVAGAVGSIAAGFAVGGPIGAGLAAVTTAVGFITGSMDEAKKKSDEWTGSVQGLAQAYIDAKENQDALGGVGQQTAEKFLSENIKAIDKATEAIKKAAAGRKKDDGVEDAEVVAEEPPAWKPPAGEPEPPAGAEPPAADGAKDA